ncbi:hypothetical protein PENSPDRAFT_293933 [Peniophora sp. CONT]|nr:hypothetical protein PENSPDRAFT_293933 [Peniophora sp. CONT]
MTVAWDNLPVLSEQYLDFVKLQHALFGVYIWEMMNSLGFDWELLRTLTTASNSPKPQCKIKRLYCQSTSALCARLAYLACRYCALAAILTIIAGYNVTSSSEINCKVWIVCMLTVSFAALTSASALIAIRVIAIWNRSKIVIGLVTSALAIQLGSFIRRLTQANAVWSPINGSCLFLNTQANQANITATFATDSLLLFTMLFGLFKWRDARRRHGIWDLLWRQGLMWLALATIAEVPTVVFVWLNLNLMNVMFFTPELVILAIGATRMYRALWAHDTAAYDLSAISTLEIAPPSPVEVHLNGIRRKCILKYAPS